jgi:hypothetical protein
MSDLRLIFASLAFLVATGCATDDKSSTKERDTSPPPAAQNLPPDQFERECASVLVCAQKCAEWYPFRSEQEIRNSLTGAGGRLIKELERNDELIEQHNICMALPASDVMG